MSRKIQIEKKLAVLNVIKEKKSILFASFKNNRVSKLDKQAAWEDVLKKAQSLQLASAQKTWTYARDSLFGLWKSRTMSKRDNARNTGSGGGKDKVMDEADLAILDILESDSAVVDGLNLPESYGNSENLPSAENDSRISISEETIANPPLNPRKRKRSTKFPSETLDREKKCRLELLEVEVYYRKLQCLKLERELLLPPSAITLGIATAETENISRVLFEEV
ncbi:uncharacterized protein LOC125777788 [Bactrocera dorsalis]|uniref:Uncharacterized protein LOC125776719 n=1 Tax=Bactrocera dorsalis TaxID=27457 RepID=A0ABM3JAG2_BACDO|nr:uncharacterized protein LOC125776719 [Bactrocera dorsalis]XP_049309330.1 uncharacterized protein LOC125777788 [Bactrocera dorsalis]